VNATVQVDSFMLAFLALLRFFVDGPVESAHQAEATAAVLGWSLAAFVVASAALLVDLCLEWHRGTRRLDREARFRRALAQLLLDPSDASRTELRQLIDVDC
jgi:hypothetical protein